MFKRCFSVLLALCLLLTTSSIAYMEESIDTAQPAGETVLSDLADETVGETEDQELGEVTGETPDASGDVTEAPAVGETPADDDTAPTDTTPADDTAETDTVESEEEVVVVTAEDSAAEIVEASADNDVELVESAESSESVETVEENGETAKVATEAVAEAVVGEALGDFVMSGNAKKTVSVGDTFQIVLNGKTAKSFKSSKRKVASVTGAGLVTAKAAGKTKITIKISKKKKWTLTLTVVDPSKPTSVYLTTDGVTRLPGTITVNMGSPVTLIPVALSANGTAVASTYKWKSSKKKVAKVSAGGVITPKKIGTTTVTVQSVRGGKKVKSKIVVKVANPYGATKVTMTDNGGGSIGGGMIYLFVKSTLQLNATLTPSFSTDKVKWSSSNKSVATVKNGLVRAKKKGTVKITAKATSGKKAWVKIKVIKKGGKARSLTDGNSDEDAYVGAVHTAEVITDPLGANANIVWSSSDPGVLEVVRAWRSGDLHFYCEVQGKALGTATITATDTISGLSVSHVWPVKEPPAPESITFPDGGVYSMSVGQSLDIKYDVNPSTSYNHSANHAEVTYDTNILSIAYEKNNAWRNCLGTMDYYLHVTALNPGTTTVTVTLRNGVTGSITITVS